VSPQSSIEEFSEPTTPSVEERVSDDVTLRAVLTAFAQLSPEDQHLMRLLCAVPPLDYQTIAELLGRPIGSIGPTRARCLERLKKLLPPGFNPKEGLS
jgi:DNA-directed RNA polymerase specialized sigma24 family protein